jgi:hypothetical protein
MAASGDAKWGLPAAEHTASTGTVTAVPADTGHGTVVVVVEADIGGFVVVVSAVAAGPAAGPLEQLANPMAANNKVTQPSSFRPPSIRRGESVNVRPVHETSVEPPQRPF